MNIAFESVMSHEDVPCTMAFLKRSLTSTRMVAPDTHCFHRVCSLLMAPARALFMLVDTIYALDKPWSTSFCRRDLSVQIPLSDCLKSWAISRRTIVSRIKCDKYEKDTSIDPWSFARPCICLGLSVTNRKKSSSVGLDTKFVGLR